MRKDARLLVLLGAAVLPDVGDVVLSLARTCNPLGVYTHSIPAAAALAVLAGALALALGDAGLPTGESPMPRGNWKFALGVVVIVLLHLPADWITGIKILWPGGPVFELNLYRWPWADFLLEAPLVVLAWLLLRRSGGGPRWATGRGALVALLTLQLAFDIAAPFTRHAGTERREELCGPEMDRSP
jgi:hypothetical protein